MLSSRFRQYHSGQKRYKEPIRYKRSGSGDINNNKSVVSKIIRDSTSQQQIISRPSQHQLNSRYQPYLCIRTNRRNSHEKRSSKVYLKPIVQKQLGGKMGPCVGDRANDQERGQYNGELEVEQIFYRQVRILQEFKKLSRMVT